MSPNIQPIFICKANVGRSQIAEGIFNHLYGSGSSLSIAGSEARKEKYQGAPDIGVTKILREYKGVDISNQRIKYVSDILEEQLSQYNLAVFLFDPLKESVCDTECRKNGMSPYEYFKTLNIPIIIQPITDPFEVDSDSYLKIIDDINELVIKVDGDI